MGMFPKKGKTGWAMGPYLVHNALERKREMENGRSEGGMGENVNISPIRLVGTWGSLSFSV